MSIKIWGQYWRISYNHLLLRRVDHHQLGSSASAVLSASVPGPGLTGEQITATDRPPSCGAAAVWIHGKQEPTGGTVRKPDVGFMFLLTCVHHNIQV